MTVTPENPLSLADVEQIVSLVAQAGDPTVEMGLPERKRKLVEGVAKLVGADVFIWSTSIPDPNNLGDVMTVCLIDGGWASVEQQMGVYQALSNVQWAAELQAPIVAAAMNRQYVTLARKEIVSDERWTHKGELWRKTGLDHLLLNVYPIDDRCYSCVAFHRFLGRPAFTPRERAIVHVILRQVDWLHRHATNSPASDKVIHLAPRERQTIVLLLAGDTKREIAKKLQLSEHTVGDYTKSIYRRFNVNSRGELQALFMLGQAGEVTGLSLDKNVDAG